MQLPGFHLVGGAAAFVSPGTWQHKEVFRNRAASAGFGMCVGACRGPLVLEGACREAQLCLQPAVTPPVHVSNSLLRPTVGVSAPSQRVRCLPASVALIPPSCLSSA